MNALVVDEMISLPPSTLPPALPEPAGPLRFERFIDLAALPTALLCTRLFVASTLHGWGARFLKADAELLAVELVRHSVATCGVIDEGVRLSDLEDVTVIRLRLLGFERSIGIEAWDTATEPAWLPAHDPAGELHGLALVDARAKNWGSTVTPRGRVTWAELDMYERSAVGLPQRTPSPVPPAAQPGQYDIDPELLRRVRDGLRDL